MNMRSSRVPLGETLADLGVNLLTGGGGGVMTSVSRAFTRRPNRRGICIGIIPCASESDRATPRDGYPNEFVELAIYTHLPYSGAQGTPRFVAQPHQRALVRGHCGSAWRRRNGGRSDAGASLSQARDCVLADPWIGRSLSAVGPASRSDRCGEGIPSLARSEESD